MNLCKLDVNLNLIKKDKESNRKLVKSLRKTLHLYEFLVILCDVFILLMMNTILLVVYALIQRSSFYWTLVVHPLPTIIRVLCLVANMCCSKVNVTLIVGIGTHFKMYRHIKYYNTLFIWSWTGLLDLIFLRSILLLVDFFYYIFHIQTMPFVQISLYLTLDVLYILEFFFSIWMVYFKGIYMNSMNKIVPGKQKKKKKTKMTKLIDY